MSEIAFNVERYLESTISSLQDAYGNYKKAMSGYLENMWYNNDGELTVSSGLEKKADDVTYWSNRVIYLRSEVISLKAQLELSKPELNNGVKYTMTDDEWRENFPKRIKSVLEETGISQRELANRLGINEVTIGRYINGERVPKITVMYNIAKALNCTIDSLVCFDKIN